MTDNADSVYVELKAAIASRKQINARIRKLRSECVSALKTLPYQEYLQTKHWKELRQKMLKKAKHKCRLCHAENKTLNVHHKTYKHIGNEKLTDLIVLCQDCHAKHHDKLAS
jgi:5-methylcytosine-specific restriction endonuclease McrA